MRGEFGAGAKQARMGATRKKRVVCLVCGFGKFSVGAFGLACVKNSNLKFKINTKF